MIYDVVMMVTSKNIPLLRCSYRYLLENLGAQNIIFVAREDDIIILKHFFVLEKRIKYLNEDEVLRGLTFNRIRCILEEICKDGHRTGWFFQQFLKMAYAYRCSNEYYLVFDADTIPLNNIEYFDEDRKPRFVTKREYHEPYFKTIAVLFDGDVGRCNKDISYIAENMIISSQIMIELIERIQNNDRLIGNVFYENILYAIDSDYVSETGYSEFETYGNYVKTYYPDLYVEVKIRSQRLGSYLFGPHPSEKQLEWASKDYDIMSFETHGSRRLEKRTKSKWVRKFFSARFLFIFFMSMDNVKCFFRGKPITRIRNL